MIPETESNAPIRVLGVIVSLPYKIPIITPKRGEVKAIGITFPRGAPFIAL